MADLFEKDSRRTSAEYGAKDIEVLEGLEPVRRRPGMYIGGTDERAMHHLVAEILDNSMDEAVAGHASRIEMELDKDGFVTIRDNGRGIPVEPHPKIKGKTALEVAMTMLHAGGKFGGKAYATSGGLHGVGLSVVNALSDQLIVESVRNKELFTQEYSRGKPVSKLKKVGPATNRRGTTVRFHADPQIFGKENRFRAARLYRMARSKAYLFRGVEIRWRCDPKLVTGEEDTPAEATLHFEDGLVDFLQSELADRKTVTQKPFMGHVGFPEDQGRCDWAIAWPSDGEGFVHSYCNTVPTPEGGTHEAGLRSGLTRSLKAYGELIGNRKVAPVTTEDIMGGACVLLSVFIRDPQFQGQTKEKLATVEAQKLVDATIKDHFDHWLTADPDMARDLLDRVIEIAEERLRRKEQKELTRKTATRKLRLPGKLADCTRDEAEGTELFLVEGDSAGGSAKQARDREIQAVLPLRGKILNVASASADKLKGNQELTNLVQALGCGLRDKFDASKLRYDRIIIMTDADVDGAHIASLLMTFFYQEMPGLIESGHLYLAVPPLYRLSAGKDTAYARDDRHKDDLMASVFKGRKVELSRFKGLGEMMAAQLKETTMDPAHRSLLRVRLPDRHAHDTEDRAAARKTADLVETLMGRKPELRFEYIQENAKFVKEVDV